MISPKESLPERLLPGRNIQPQRPWGKRRYEVPNKRTLEAIQEEEYEGWARLERNRNRKPWPRNAKEITAHVKREAQVDLDRWFWFSIQVMSSDTLILIIGSVSADFFMGGHLMFWNSDLTTTPATIRDVNGLIMAH